MEIDLHTFGAIKRQFVEFTGLSKDVLHVYLGLILTAVAGMPRWIRPWDWRLLILPLLVAGAGEMMDITSYRQAGAPVAEWAPESAKDLLNTLLVPALMILMARRVRREG